MAPDSASTASTEKSPSSDCCDPVTHSMSDSALDADLETLAALSGTTRYEALRCLAEADSGVCVCQLEAALDVSQGAVSQALSRLARAGLVDRRKRGRWRYYSTTDRAEAVLETLDAIRTTDE